MAIKTQDSPQRGRAHGKRRRSVHPVLAAIVFLLSSALAPAHALSPGDVFVVGLFGPLFRVDPVTGVRILVSDTEDDAQGPLGGTVRGVAIEASEQILVIGSGASGIGALLRVDAATGARILVSDFSDGAQGPLGSRLFGVTIEASGQILVVDLSAGAGPAGALFRVDPATGARTLFSDFADAAQGLPVGLSGRGVAIEASGQILVISAGGASGNGALLRVDPATGVRTLLSDFGDVAQGPLVSPFGVTVDASGQILVVGGGGTSGLGTLLRVDPTTGARTLLSDFGDGAQGPLGGTLRGVAIEASGQILVTDQSTGALWRVDPATGVRTLLSDFGDGAQGPTGGSAYGVAIANGTAIDGTIDDPVIGGVVTDTTFGSRAQVSFPAGVLTDPTDVTISVFQEPPEAPTPAGFSAPGTLFVEIDLDPTPLFPLVPPGLTVVLPIEPPLPPETTLSLYRINPSTGSLEPALDVIGMPVTGTVDAPDGLSATFQGIGSLSTVVGLRPLSPTNEDDCKEGGWQNFRRADGSVFKNQGDCIQYVNTGK